MTNDTPAQSRPLQMPRAGFPARWWVGIAVILALMAPFLLWPIEQWVHQPVIIEELFKVGLVWLVIRGASTRRAWWVLLVAIAFSVSETMFYLPSAFQDMAFGDWGLRWVTAVPMHLLTFLVQYLGWMMGAWPIGLLVAMGIHLGFNSQILQIHK